MKLSTAGTSPTVSASSYPPGPCEMSHLLLFKQRKWSQRPLKYLCLLSLLLTDWISKQPVSMYWISSSYYRPSNGFCTKMLSLAHFCVCVCHYSLCGVHWWTVYSLCVVCSRIFSAFCFRNSDFFWLLLVVFV